MPACRDVLQLIDDMVDVVRETIQPGERGFIVCERDGRLEIGARCKGDSYHCSVESTPCPGGARPAFSFHTHTTKVPLVEALIGEELPFIMAEELVLLPSAKDMKTDNWDFHVPVSCVGGMTKEGARITCIQWKESMHLRDVEQITDIQNRAKAIGFAPTPNILDELLDSYYKVTGKPCLELRLSNEELEAKPWRGPKHTRTTLTTKEVLEGLRKCPTCGGA